MKDIKTKFPESIDDRLFFMDTDIPHVPVMKHYHNLLNAGNYTTASEYLKHSDVFYYGAWLFNLLENRLYKIGEYLMGEEKPDFIMYLPSDISENDLSEGIHFIEEDH